MGPAAIFYIGLWPERPGGAGVGGHLPGRQSVPRPRADAARQALGLIKVYWVQMSEDALKRTQLARARALQSLRRVA